jgi:hypothetical protein
LPRAERLNLIARRQLEDIGKASGDRFVSERADIIRAAKALLDDLDLDEETDIFAVMEVASFLAGDNVEGS